MYIQHAKLHVSTRSSKSWSQPGCIHPRSTCDMSCSGMTAHCCHEPRHMGYAHQHPPFRPPVGFNHASLCEHVSHSGTSATTDPSYFTYLQLSLLPHTSLFSFEEAWVAKCWIPEITWRYTVAPAGVLLERGLKGGDTMLQSLDSGRSSSLEDDTLVSLSPGL